MSRPLDNTAKYYGLVQTIARLYNSLLMMANLFGHAARYYDHVWKMVRP